MKRLTHPVLVTVLVFSALTSLFTYPIWTAPNRLLADNLDGRLNAWIMAWDAHALVNASASLFDANIFHPFARTLAYSENLLGAALLVAPLNWAGFPVLAYNAVFLFSFLLSGVAMTLWARSIAGSWGAGIVAGIVWAFAPSKTDHLSHLQLLASMWVPVALWLLTRYLRDRTRGLVLLAAGLLGLQYWTGIQITLVTLPFVGLYFLAAWWHRPARHEGEDRRLLLEALPAAVVFMSLVIPISLPYLRLSQEQGLGRSLAETVQFNARPLGFLAGSWSNRAVHMEALHRVFGKAEGNHGLGIIGSILLAVAVVVAVRVVMRGLFRDPGTRGPESWRDILFAGSASVAALATAIHLGGVAIAAVGWTDLPWADRLLAASRGTAPPLWMAVAGTVAVFSWRPPRDAAFRQRAAVVLLWLTGIAYLLALGPEAIVRGESLGSGPFALLYEWAVPYRSIRSVGRFGITWTLFAAPLLGLASDVVVRRVLTRVDHGRWLRWSLFAVLATGLVLEFRTWPLNAADGTLHEPEVYEALAELPEDGGVLHLPLLPWNNPASATEYMLGSTLHWRPLVNGYSGFMPGDLSHLLRLDPASPDFWDRLRTGFPVDHVVVHRRHASESRYLDLARLLAESRRFRRVRQFASATIFAFDPGVERNDLIQRRFPGHRLRRAAGVTFDVRRPGPETGASLDTVQVLWSTTLAGECPLRSAWTRCTATQPAEWSARSDGTATLQIWTPPPPGYGIPLGNTDTRLTTELLVDAQLNALGLARNDRWERVHPSSGALVAHMDLGGRQLLDVRIFPTTDLGMAAMETHIRQRVPEGHIVAVALHLLEDRPSAEARTNHVRAALRLIGATGELPDDAWAHAFLGVRGAAPGDALEQHAPTWASVRAGPAPAAATRIAVRDIRLLNRSPATVGR